MNFSAAGSKAVKIILLFASIFRLNGLASTVSGTIQGRVVDDTGQSVGGARVLISQALPPNTPVMQAPPVVTGPLIKTLTADASGTFSAELRAGQYVACAQLIAPGLLDPCHWATSAPEFTVVAGERLAGIRITMAKGAVIRIHVNDPQGLLKAVTGPIDFDCRFYIVTSRGLHYNANIQASSVGSRDLAVTVPFGAPLTLQVISPHLVVTDQSGNAVSAAGASVSVAAGAAPADGIYTVAGRK